MDINIPVTIRYNRRDYTIGQRLELDSSMRGGDVDNHPLFKLMLQYICSPFSDNNYNDIEDDLTYFLMPSFMNKVAEEDKDLDFDENEYKLHVEYAWKAIQELTTAELLEKLKPYVGNYEQIERALSGESGLTDEGKTVRVSDVNTEIGTDHIMSSHTKGIESKKIWQASDKQVSYEPALEKINDTDDGNRYFTIEVSNKSPTKLPLRYGTHKATFQEQEYIIEIDFQRIMEKLFEEAGISVEVLRGRRGDIAPTAPKDKQGGRDNTEQALAEAMEQAGKIKKSLELIIKEENMPEDEIKEDDKYDFSNIKVYNPHPDYTLSELEEETLERINLKIAWNALHEEKQFDYEDEVSSGDFDAEEIVRQFREGQMDEIAQLAGKMLDAGVMTQTAYDALLDEGKVPGKKGFIKREKALISDVVEFKSNMKNPLGMNEFEQAQYTKETVKTRKDRSNVLPTKNRSILHNKDSDKTFFTNNSWTNLETAVIDLKNGASNSRELKNHLDRALIPNKVGTMVIVLSVVHPTDEEKKAREDLLNDEDTNISGNAEYILENIYDVFSLVSVSYAVSTEYKIGRMHSERMPERRSMATGTAKKYKVSGAYTFNPDKETYGSKTNLMGGTDAGGQRVYIDNRTNTILFYIKKQINDLQKAIQ